MRSPRTLLLAGLLALVFVLPACGTRYKRVPLVDDPDMRVVLRTELSGRSEVPKDHAQPATISSVRVAHILATLDVRMGGNDEEIGDRVNAIPTELIFPLGDQISSALAKADPSQEVAVQAIRREKKLGLFTHRYLTSLIAFVDAKDRLQLHLYRVDWPIPKGDEDTIKEPRLGVEVMDFRVISAPGVVPIGPQAVAVSWRDERFRKASHIKVGKGGRVQRRTVLMESDAPITDLPDLPDASLDGLTDPDVLRELADLEEARRDGEVSEGEYNRQREALLSGRDREIPDDVGNDAFPGERSEPPGQEAKEVE